MDIFIERTYDAKIIHALATAPSIFPHVSDDFTADPMQWKPFMGELVCNLVARDDDGFFGFGIFLPRTHCLYEAHMGFLPRSYGKRAATAFLVMLRWMWDHTQALRIVGEVPVNNWRAIAFAKQAGFRKYGLNVKSSLRGGVLRDQVCLGISKPS